MLPIEGTSHSDTECACVCMYNMFSMSVCVNLSAHLGGLLYRYIRFLFHKLDEDGSQLVDYGQFNEVSVIKDLANESF